MPWIRLMVATAVVAAVVGGATSLSHAINPFKRSGFELSESDITLLKAAAEKLYLVEGVEIGAAEAWNNADTGNNGTVTLTRKHAYKGMPCRRLRHDIRVKTSGDPFRFIVDRCKTADVLTTTRRERPVKIGSKVVRHGRYITFQLAEVAVSRVVFAEILRLIDGLRPTPLPP